MTKAWTLEFRMQVHANCSACSTEDVNLIFTAGIPFLPFNGLVVKINDNLWLKVEKLHWFCDDNKFVSFSEDKQFYSGGLQQRYATRQEMWDHVQKNYLANGWLIKSGGMLWPRCPEHGSGMQPGGTPLGEGAVPQWWCWRKGASHFVSETNLDLGYIRRMDFDD